MAKGNKIIYLIDRDNWQKDNSVNHILITYLKKSNWEIRWEDPAGKFIYELRKIQNRYKWIPNYLKNTNLRIVQILYGIFNPSYFHYLSYRRTSSIETRAEQLKKNISNIGNNKEIIILSKSAGGRFASYIADELNIKHLISISYPFQNPDEQKNSTRYKHLENLKTPMLIIQGDRDEYGGIEECQNYILSPKIELFFVDADHDFIVNKNDWKRIINKLDKIIMVD